MSSSAKKIYLDHAAATPVRKEVLKAMELFFNFHFGNPSSLYSEGQFAQKALLEARKTVASVLNSQPDTITFTSGGTESDNLAVVGTAKALKDKGMHIVSVATEHHAVLEPLRILERLGWNITYLPVDKNGFVTAEEVKKAIRPETVLISVMYANNEIGTIQPIADIGRMLLQYRKNNKTSLPYFHTDSCQAAGYLPLDVEKLHVDLMTLNGGKIYGPKGAGALYVRRGVPLEPVQMGGDQENKRRAGTENIPGIVGFSKALELVAKEASKESARVCKLSRYFFDKLHKNFSGILLNGPEIGEGRLPNNVNILIPSIDGEKYVIYLDTNGVMCSTASACTAISSEPSHVIQALGRSETEVRSSLRFTLGKSTSKKDIDKVIKILQKVRKLLSE